MCAHRCTLTCFRCTYLQTYIFTCLGAGGRYKAAAAVQRGADKSEPISLTSTASGDPAPVTAPTPMDDEPTPWASRAVFPVSHTSPFWRSVSPSPLASTEGTAALSSLSKGAINTQHAPQASVLPAGVAARGGSSRSRARREAPRKWSGDGSGGSTALPARYGANPWVAAEQAGTAAPASSQSREKSTMSSNPDAERRGVNAGTEEDLWADELTSTEVSTAPNRIAQRSGGSGTDFHPHAGAASTMDTVETASAASAAAAAALSEGSKEILEESEAALNARVRALQLENAKLELEYQRLPVTVTGKDP